jgi:hypothetical protein
MDLNNPEQIKQLIGLLQNLLDQNIQQSEDEDDEPVSKIRTKTTRSGNKKKTKNKFLDMPEKNMHKEDIDIDKKLSKTAPTPRTRKFKPVKVSCRVCGRSESVSPSVIPESAERYKCNRCSGSAGG